MALSLSGIVLLLIYAVSINLILVNLASLGIGIECPQMSANNKTDENSIINMALGRCDGLPFWIVLAFELPVIVGLLYIIRGFIGAT